MRAGHEVHLLCQDRDPLALEWVDAAGDWDGGRARGRRRAASRSRATVYRPDIGGLLPLYVADRYEGVEARPVPGALRRRARRATSSATSPPCARWPSASRPDVALANHLVMGPRRSSPARSRTASRTRSRSTAARWSTRSSRTRASCPYAREGLARARGVLVGSRHTAESLWAAMDDPTLPAAHAARPAGRRRRALRAARAGRGARGPGSAARARWRRPTSAGADDDARSPATAGEAAAALATIDARRPPRGLRRQADRLQGRRAAAGRLAARARRASRDARLLIVGFGAFRPGSRASRGDSRAATSRPPAPCAPRTAPSCRTSPRSSTASTPDGLPRGRARA